MSTYQILTAYVNDHSQLQNIGKSTCHLLPVTRSRVIMFIQKQLLDRLARQLCPLLYDRFDYAECIACVTPNNMITWLISFFHWTLHLKFYGVIELTVQLMVSVVYVWVLYLCWCLTCRFGCVAGRLKFCLALMLAICFDIVQYTASLAVPTHARTTTELLRFGWMSTKIISTRKLVSGTTKRLQYVSLLFVVVVTLWCFCWIIRK